MDLTCDERLSDSLFVQRIWHSNSENGGAFTSMAEPHWSIVVTQLGGKKMVTVRGPETRATPAFSPADAEFFGIHFKPSVIMPLMPPIKVKDRNDITLPDAGSQSFWLDGSAWEIPDYENADTFVGWLVREGLLIHDPVVEAVLSGTPIQTLSLRTVQRRFLSATGMTYGTINQICRARHALALLKQKVPILDVVEQANYADQPHLTRSLRQFTAQTPAQILSSEQREPLSFLFKTLPF